jgi:hypothetical protein
MTACPPRAGAMFTAFFASDDSEATARRTGFVKRTAKITGNIVLALVTFGVWHDADTTLAQLTAPVTQLAAPRAVSPEAMAQRMNKPALAFLQDRSCHARAKGQALEHGCDDGRLPALTKVYLAASTGLALPHSLRDLFPGSGGSAPTAGAKMQAVWDYQRRGWLLWRGPPGPGPISSRSTWVWP